MRDARSQAVAETSAFLTWALREGNAVPRIPRRRVDQGGFEALLSQPGGRRVADRWWGRVFGLLAEWTG